MPDDRVWSIPLTDLEASPHQNRVFPKEPDDALRQLAKSIESQGVIEPIIVRPVERRDVPYQIVAGERRWRASGLAKLDTIPALVRELDDPAAMEITVEENMQRADLRPLEEARGVETLLELHDGDVETVADRLRVAPSWVARRAHLAKNLAPEWVEAASNPEDPVAMWSASHLAVVARIEPKMQAALLKEREFVLFDDSVPPTVARLRKVVEEFMCKLSEAPWKLDDAELLPDAGPCVACTKRTNCAPLLFDELDTGEDDRCLDRQCWREKLQAFLTARIATLRRVHGKRLVGHQPVPLPPPKLDIRRVQSWDFETCKKTDEGARPCLYLNGPKIGNIFWVRLRQDQAPVKKKRQQTQKTKGQTLEEKRAALVCKRTMLAVENIVAKFAPEDETSGPPLPPPPLDVVVRLAATFGCSGCLDWFNGHRSNETLSVSLPEEKIDAYRKDLGTGLRTPGAWAVFDLYGEKNGKHHLLADLWNLTREVIAERFLLPNLADSVLVQVVWYEAQRVAELLGIDAAAELAAAVEALPEPEGWQDEEAKAAANKKAKAKKAAAEKSAPDKTNGDELITLTEVSKRSGISMPTLQRYRKIHADRIPCTGEGRKRRYPVAAIDVFKAIRSESKGAKA